MKSRTVFLLFEVETDIPIKHLKKKEGYELREPGGRMMNITQVQANVSKEGKEPMMGKGILVIPASRLGA